MSSENGSSSTRAQLLEAIRETDRFLLTTHERPDGDAVGSLAAMQLVLSALGKDSLAFVAADEFPLPYEYRFIQPRGPGHRAARATSASACSCSWTAATSTARSADQLKHEDHRILNIDHHHDNTRFGTINHVDGSASCTAEMVWDLMQDARRGAHAGDRRGALRRPGHRHGPLHVREHRAARARDGRRAARRRASTAHGIYRRLYEGMPQGKLELLARGLTHVERYDGGLLTVTHLTLEDYRATGADESYSEGVVDHLRSVEGTAVAALIRDLLTGDAPQRKVSLRATDGRVDVSRIARSQGGGGHRRAAGFSTDLDFPELVEVLRTELARQL